MNHSVVTTRVERAAPLLPAIIAREEGNAAERFIEFFTANISNDNTRAAYARAVSQFLNWCEKHGTGLRDIKPVMIAAYIKQHSGSIPTIKQHLAAINMLFDWLVTGQILPMNPAASVRAPRYSTKKGKTPVLSGADASHLINSINTSHVVGLRDRALIALMVYSFARVSAVVNMNVRDYYANGKRFWIRLHEKGGKFHEVPVHHNAEEYLDEYIEAAGIINEKNAPIFRTAKGKTQTLTANRMSRHDAFYMIRRRAVDAGITAPIGCHTFRATGITAYLENGGTIEHAQTIAAHESPRTTKLYDRTGDAISLDEIERIIL
jgi:site-specific recombinase XerD